MGQEIKIWGKVEDCAQQSVDQVKIALLKKYHMNRRSIFRVVEWGYTDQNGYYTFYIQSGCSGDYKVVVYTKGGQIE